MQKNEKTTLFVYGQLLLLALSAGAIFRLVYLRANLQEPLMEALQLNIKDLNALYSWLGFTIVAGYLPSGWLADRFKAKNLIIIALVLTATLSFALSFLPTYHVARWLYAGLGVTSVFIFWSAHMRSAKLLATEHNTGKIFGILDGARGGSEALLATLAILLFQYIFYHYENQWINPTMLGMQWVFRFFGFIQLFLAGLVWLFLHYETRADHVLPIQERKERGSFLAIFKDVPRYTQWQILLMSLAIFSGYTIFFTGFSFYSLLNLHFGASTSSVAWVISIMLWMRLIGAMGGGFLADKMDKIRLLKIVMSFSMLGIIVLLILPLSLELRYVLVIIIGLSNAMIRGIYWSLIEYIEIEEQYLGRVIGFISFMGYLPDFLLPLMSLYLFQHWQEVTANLLYLWISVGIGALGLIGLQIFSKMAKQK